jgi:endonuclease YncB( thermonuclease family)
MTEQREWDYQVSAVVRVVDGDTFDLTLRKRMDFGFRLVEDKEWSTRFRLLDIDAPETNREGGSAATAFATEWLADAVTAGVLRGQTFKSDNFGRWLIDLYRVDTGAHLAQTMIDTGHGVPYVGH